MWNSDRTTLLALLALVSVVGGPSVAVAQTQSARAGVDVEGDERETDDLPPWAQYELERAQAIQYGGNEAEAQTWGSYGADIPDPEEVMAGSRQSMAPSSPPAPARGGSAAAPPQAAVGYDDFHEELSPHGRWVDTPEYGSVFVPTRQRQVSDWRPYLYGQWVWTSYGWTWASDEPFGWATYHYGRWAFGPSLGWMWVPGYTWGPAWVTWRYGEGAVGWAPLYPGYVSWTTSYPYHLSHWIFVGPTHFYGHPIHRHWYRDRGSYYYSHSSWGRNWRSGERGRVYAGPPRGYVERRGSVRVVESRVVPVTTPNRGGVVGGKNGRVESLQVYRPTNRGAVRSRAVSQAQAPARRIGSGLEPERMSPETRARLNPPAARRGVDPKRPVVPSSQVPGQRGGVDSPRLPARPDDRVTPPAPRPGQRQENRQAPPTRRASPPTPRGGDGGSPARPGPGAGKGPAPTRRPGANESPSRLQPATPPSRLAPRPSPASEARMAPRAQRSAPAPEVTPRASSNQRPSAGAAPRSTLSSPSSGTTPRSSAPQRSSNSAGRPSFAAPQRSSSPAARSSYSRPSSPAPSQSTRSSVAPRSSEKSKASSGPRSAPRTSRGSVRAQ